MIRRSVARRYLSAALGAADRAGVREQLGRQLDTVAELMRATPDFKRLLQHPALPLERKLEAVEAVLGDAPLDQLSDLVALLVDNARIEVLEIADAVYQELVDEAVGVVRAFVSTSMPLLPEQSRRLSDALSQWLDAEVVIDANIDPETIGGIVVRVGDRILDASLKGRLQRIGTRLADD